MGWVLVRRLPLLQRPNGEILKEYVEPEPRDTPLGEVIAIVPAEAGDASKIIKKDEIAWGQRDRKHEQDDAMLANEISASQIQMPLASSFATR